jgi:hypothetical protein
MHRIDGPGATVDNKFTDGDPVGGVEATVVTDDFMNDVQEELMTLLTAGGVTPVKGVQDQVLKAIAAILRAQLLTAVTTAGTAPAFTLTPTIPITAYSANQRFRVKFNAAATSGTLNISGLGAKDLKRYDYTGAKIAAVIAAGQLADVEYDGTDMVVLNGLTDRDGFAISLGASGYIRFPKSLGSFLVQWGFATSNIAGIDGIVLPTSHANTNYVVFCQSRDFTQNVTFGAQSTSNGTFNVTARTSSGLTGSTFHFMTMGF